MYLKRSKDESLGPHAAMIPQPAKKNKPVQILFPKSARVEYANVKVKLKQNLFSQEEFSEVLHQNYPIVGNLEYKPVITILGDHGQR